jgi:hypothetical protein
MAFGDRFRSKENTILIGQIFLSLRPFRQFRVAGKSERCGRVFRAIPRDFWSVKRYQSKSGRRNGFRRIGRP